MRVADAPEEVVLEIDAPADAELVLAEMVDLFVSSHPSAPPAVAA